MANEFERLLQQQAQDPNFLSGIVTAGAAKLMSARTQATAMTLEKLNESLKLADNGPLNKYEQIERLEGDPDAQAKLKTIEEQAQQYQSLTQNIIDRKEKFSQIYDQALTQLAQIGGEDAQRLAQQLQANKEGKLNLLDEKGEMPEKLLKYQTMKTELTWAEDQYAEWYNDTQLRKDIASASDAIVQDMEFGAIQGGDVKTWDERKLDDFTKRQDRIINRAYDNLDGQIGKGTISKAFKVAMDNTGKSFTFQDLNPLERMQMQQAGQQEKANVNLYKGILTAWSGLYNSLDNKTKDALSVYMKEGKVPSADMVDAAGNEFSNDYLEELAGIFKPDGEYGYYYSRLTAAMGDDFYKHSPYRMKSGTTIPDVPADRSLIGIIKPTGFEGFMNQEALYNPIIYEGLLDDQREKLTGLKSQSISRYLGGGVEGQEATDDFGFNIFSEYATKWGNSAFQLPSGYESFSIFGGRK